MSARDQINNIRVVRVTKRGKDAGFSALCDKLATISPDGFVAIDTEFSGMGTHPDLKHDNLETRYAALRKLADTRAIFSVGVAIFDRIHRDATMTDPHVPTPQSPAEPLRAKEPMNYEVAVFELLMSCQSEFSLSADAGEFLTTHCFDFNEMFQKGIPYVRASTEKPPEKEAEKGLPWRWGKMPRGLLWRIGRQAIPLVVHNGLLDLVFLFSAFQGPLPETLHGFISALLECVPAGFYDTKVLASVAEERASFLAYLFAKSVLTETVDVITAKRLPSNDLTDPKEDVDPVAKETLCALYAFRGFCPRGSDCPFQHDPFMVIAQEKDGKSPKDSKDAFKRHKLQTKQLKRQKAQEKSEVSKMSKKQRKRFLASKQEKVSVTANCTEEEPDIPPSPDIEQGDHIEQGRPVKSRNALKVDVVASNRFNQVHTAGWDAFSTGYVFSVYRASLEPEKLTKHRNRIALPYKRTYLFLCKSRFADLDVQTSQNEKQPEGIDASQSQKEGSGPEEQSTAQ